MESIKDVKDVISKKVKNKIKEIGIEVFIFCFIIIFLVIIIIIWAYFKLTLNNANCNRLSRLYKNTNLTITTININESEYKHNLRDYYIKTAYNCCSGGDYKNDYVNICALKNCIKQGARCLDFEIYSINNKPIISVSSLNNYNVKETYNSLPLSKVLSIINTYAFSGSTCPNPGDPLILHFRIMSKNLPIYDIIANDLSNILGNKLLDKQYCYENYNMNLSKIKLKTFMGKIIIAVDKSNALFESTSLDEYVNIASNSVFMRSLRFHNVKYSPNMADLQHYNKKHMSICLPDLGIYPNNYSPTITMENGCQFTAMAFQNLDANLLYYNKLFNDKGYAFILKPESLRYIVRTVKPKDDPHPSVDPTARTIRFASVSDAMSKAMGIKG